MAQIGLNKKSGCMARMDILQAKKSTLQSEIEVYRLIDSGQKIWRLIFYVFVIIVIASLFFLTACERGDSLPAGDIGHSFEPAVENTPDSKPQPYPFIAVAGDGEKIVFEEPPDRIVALDSAAVEILFALGEGNRIVGTHDFVQYPKETEAIPRVGSAFSINLEQIMALEPDLVYTFFSAPVNDFNELGVRVLFQEVPVSLFGVAERIITWGSIIGQKEAALALAQEFIATIDETEDLLLGLGQAPRIFHDEAPGLWTTGAGSLANEVYSLLKAKNIFDDVDGYVQVTAEEIVARDPEVIISVHEEGIEIFKTDPAFSALDAVLNDRIYYINGDLVSIAGPRLIAGINQIASKFYPELFP